MAGSVSVFKIVYGMVYTSHQVSNFISIQLPSRGQTARLREAEVGRRLLGLCIEGGVEGVGAIGAAAQFARAAMATDATS